MLLVYEHTLGALRPTSLPTLLLHPPTPLFVLLLMDAAAEILVGVIVGGWRKTEMIGGITNNVVGRVFLK